MASNPVLNKLKSAPGVAAPSRPAPSAEQLEQMYRQPSYGGTGYPPAAPAGQRDGGWGGAPARYMSLDDVIARTGAMLAMVFAAGAVTWALTPAGMAGALIMIGAMGGLALGLYMTFKMRVNAATALIYSALEGLALGGISKIFEARFPGIVVQALTGTVMVAAGMLIVYRIGAIRVTPRFTRMVVGATFGVFGLMVVNLIAYLFHPGGLGLRSGGAIAILFSILCIVLAAFNLVIDFDVIEQGIRRGADQKFAWYASFGLMVTLVWLYIELLRLLGYMRSN
ncbi:MAG: Bax inhibitor-1/YccA family protein [Actinomycetia bacterium]|nr:Bax inhibitor-1/YccA family protein [Actinomycetes bacterium]